MKALILLDLQNDFMPGGPLAVPHADEAIPVANRVQSAFDLVVATQDWHPANHGSFAANHPGRRPGDIIELSGLRQILWPVHCVQGTLGAALVAELDVRRIARVIQKGTDPGIDSYSGFFDNGRRQATGLFDYLRENGIRELHVLGVATDYCVLFTVLDALKLGLKTHLIADGCRGIELRPGDVARAMQRMRRAGAAITRACDVPR